MWTDENRGELEIVSEGYESVEVVVRVLQWCPGLSAAVQRHRTENPRVGGSIPSLATNLLNAPSNTEFASRERLPFLPERLPPLRSGSSLLLHRRMPSVDPNRSACRTPAYQPRP